MTTGAIIVANTLPAQFTALSAELVRQRDELAGKADTLKGITDLPTLAEAESLFVSIDRFTKQVSEDRLVLTRQIDDIKKQIMAVERNATVPLDDRRLKVAKLISEYRLKLVAEQREIERKALDEANKIAAEIRKRQDDERKADLAKWEEEKAAAAKEAAMFGEAPAPVAPPPAVKAVPVVPVTVLAPAPVLPKSVVRTTTKRRTIIENRLLLIGEACKDLGRLFGKQVLIIDERAVDDLMKAGVAVPGAKTENYESLSATGRGTP